MKIWNTMKDTIWSASHRQMSSNLISEITILTDGKTGGFGSEATAECWGQSQLSCVLHNALLMACSRYHSCHHNRSLCPYQQRNATCRRVDLCPPARVPFQPRPFVFLNYSERISTVSLARSLSPPTHSLSHSDGGVIYLGLSGISVQFL